MTMESRVCRRARPMGFQPVGSRVPAPAWKLNNVGNQCHATKRGHPGRSRGIPPGYLAAWLPDALATRRAARAWLRVSARRSGEVPRDLASRRASRAAKPMSRKAPFSTSLGMTAAGVVWSFGHSNFFVLRHSELVICNSIVTSRCTLSISSSRNCGSGTTNTSPVLACS